MRTLTRRIVSFLAAAGLLMGALPLANSLRADRLSPTRSNAYDTTALWSAIGVPLRKLGISTRPRQVVIGRSGWLFAGDQYAMSVTDKRRDATPEDEAAAARRAAALVAWATWLEDHGVADWRVLICADKDSVYPDRLPAWYRPSASRPIEAAMRLSDHRHVIDTRRLLRDAAAGALPLYPHTDTHWTERGAFLAYRAWADSYAGRAPARAWLDESQVTFARARIPTSDLARLLQASDLRDDEGVSMRLDAARTEGRTLEDALTHRPVDASVFARPEAPTFPVLTRSPGALNKRRLLWLRDSFGGRLHPFVAATFDEVIEIDRESTPPARFEALVRGLRPDSVLISVVERNARSTWFEAPPP